MPVAAADRLTSKFPELHSTWYRGGKAHLLWRDLAERAKILGRLCDQVCKSKDDSAADAEKTSMILEGLDRISLGIMPIKFLPPNVLAADFSPPPWTPNQVFRATYTVELPPSKRVTLAEWKSEENGWIATENPIHKRLEGLRMDIDRQVEHWKTEIRLKAFHNGPNRMALFIVGINLEQVLGETAALASYVNAHNPIVEIFQRVLYRRGHS